MASEIKRELREFKKDIQKLFIFKVGKNKRLVIGQAHPVMQAVYILIGAGLSYGIFLGFFLTLYVILTGFGLLF